jgi:hypothetical protein
MADTKFPFGLPDTQAIVGTGAKAVTVYDHLTILELSALTGNVTLNLTFGQSYIKGARMTINVVQGSTGRDVALGTGFAASAADLTGVANDTDVIELYYNGTSMIPFSDWEKIVDAA